MLWLMVRLLILKYRMQHKHYIIYKTTDTLTGEYYIGQHRTNNLKDGYKGSGNWIRSKTKKGRILITEIIHISTKDNLCKDERRFIGDLWKTDPYCMNECPGGGSGPHTKSSKEKISNTRKQLGLKPDHTLTKNTIFMHKDGVQKRVPKMDVNNYTQQGWIQGRLVKPPNHSKKVWVTDGLNQVRTNEPEKYFEIGWVLGRSVVQYKKNSCPHCGVEGGVNVMKRWHMDRCKFKK